jgi:hypothetical protein
MLAAPSENIAGAGLLYVQNGAHVWGFDWHGTVITPAKIATFFEEEIEDDSQNERFWSKNIISRSKRRSLHLPPRQESHHARRNEHTSFGPRIDADRLGLP